MGWIGNWWEEGEKKIRDTENKDLDRTPLNSSISKEENHVAASLISVYAEIRIEDTLNIYCLDRCTDGLKKGRMEREREGGDENTLIDFVS